MYLLSLFLNIIMFLQVCAKYTHGGSVKGEIDSVFSSTRSSYRRKDHREFPQQIVVGDEEECGVLRLAR